MSEVDRLARERLRADEAKRRSIGLGDAARDFWRHPSPWLISVFLVAIGVTRVVVGDWRWSDAVTPLVMLAVFPFFEWVVHVCVLHWRPRRLGPLTVDPLLSRKHREHHVDPRDIPLVFIPWQVFLWLLPVILAIGLLLFPRAGLGLTFMTVVGLLGIGYEWTHYLIHSDYRPRSRLYRAVWRNHRLHHYKNEHYWFTVTTSGTADRVLGTYPDARTVANSPTARELHSS
ncbi:sterol desaturase family protein [Actinophytocola oryzae]|uniref:Fatty acid hydroxylase family protein n=1 Tax=Actinophytocola oryzae TaxID=502181 RepID=A0A4R7V7C8_9PSEU|nr:sterol desaturase family protein [Actinophytocola oryzae]TDV44894.1 fatty acid hydroxylase family protein [Actinophytocola oryzae]